jgi:replicative DNA helicase
MTTRKPEELRKLEDHLVNYQGDDRIVSSNELAAQLDIDTPVHQLTGVPSIDRILGGVEPGEMIIVSGPTGEGKTTLLMSITANMAERNIPSVWFTLEVTPKSFIQKIKKACKDKLPLFYLPNRNTDNQLEWLEQRIIEAKTKHDVKVVFIDHVHQIFSLHRVKSNSVSLEIGDMVGKIKQIAIDHHLVIFLIAHTRDNGERPDAEPRKEEIRDSGLISRLADSIILVWRIKNDEDLESRRRPKDLGEEDTRAKVRIVKNRREGKLGTFLMNHEDGMLTELDIFSDFNG